MVTQKQKDLAAVLQLVLDDPTLQQYFHVDELPERKPLLIAKSPALPDGPPLMKFGLPVEYKALDEVESSRLPLLIFTRVEIQEKKAEVEFRYPPEGITGSAMLRAVGGWKVESMDIREQ